VARDRGAAAHCTRETFRVVAASAPALLVALLAALAFSFPNQMLDIYRDIAQTIVLGPVDPGAGLLAYAGVWRELIQSALAVAILSLSLWLAGLVLVQRRSPQGAETCRPAALARQVIPIVTALVPIVMLAVGLFSARVAMSTELDIARLVRDTFFAFNMELGIGKDMAEIFSNDFASRLVGYNATLTYYAGAVGLLALCLLGLFVLLQARAVSLAIVRARLDLGILLTALYALAVATVFVALSLVVANHPVRVAELLKPIPIFCLFCVLLLLAMDAIRRFSEITGVPLLAVALVAALAFSFAELNDNHSVRFEQAAAAAPAKPLPEATDEFRKWLSTRDDLSAVEGGRSYPVYIVAAQGGGIYAAYHVATFLSGLQTLCPNFAHHLFAVSGVSGGSVGAAIFNAMMREAESQNEVKLLKTGCTASTENVGPSYSEAVHSVLDDDLWSPLQAALLFPDFLQRFLFWPVPKFDRSLALERALEAAWLSMMNEEKFFNPDLQPVTRNYLANPYSEHWNPELLRNVPALVLNTTEVSTGHRRLIAPFRFRGTGTVNFFPLQRSSDNGNAGHLPLSTAAVLSARFPWVTPLGWIKGTLAGKQDSPKIHVVDGGYFENSGVATAFDLIKDLSEAIRTSAKYPTIEINLIILTSAEFSSEGRLGPGETLGPIETMLNTRSARALIEIDRAKQDLQAMNTDRLRFRTIEVRLRGLGYPLPLGWRLSTTTRYLIEAQRGVRGKCTQAPAEDADLNDVDCAKALIFRQLYHANTP
jgi:hypothetical protein